MVLPNFDTALGMVFMNTWCGPEDFICVLGCSKICQGAKYLKSAALFALSRKHVPECKISLPMHRWHDFWQQCCCNFRKKKWPVTLWQDACVFMVRECSFVGHAPFFKLWMQCFTFVIRLYL